MGDLKRSLIETKLHTGEKLEFSLLEFPDDEYKEKIREFFLLDHSPGLWLVNLDKWFEGVKNGMLLWFIAEAESEIVSGVAVYYSVGSEVADLGHVFTVPEYRRMGIQKMLFSEVIKELPSRGIKVVYLETGYKIPAYYMYQKYGFCDYSKPGFMRKIFTSEKDIQDLYFEPREIRYNEVKRSDLGALVHLLSTPQRQVIRSYAHGLYRDLPNETKTLEIIDSVERRKCSTTVLRDSQGRLMGICLVTQQTPTEIMGHIGILDVFVHQNYMDHAGKLIYKTIIKTEKELGIEILLAYVEKDNSIIINALKENEFNEIAKLHEYLKIGKTLTDVLLFQCARARAGGGGI